MNHQLLENKKMPEDAVEVGRIIEAWGVKGGIKLQPFSTTADGLLRVKQWFLQSPTGQIEHAEVETAKWHADTVVAQIKGMNDRDVAQSHKSWRVWVLKTALPKTADGEFYWMDLMGCAVIAIDGSVLGHVTDVSSAGVQAVLHVDCGEAYLEALIPFVGAHVGAVDLAAKTIQTEWALDWLEAK